MSVIKDEGSTVDIDATALASSSDGRASDTKEDGVRSAVKSIEPSGEKITQPDTKVKNKFAEEVGLDVDDKTESIAPKVMNSERTWTESDYVQERDKAAMETPNGAKKVCYNELDIPLIAIADLEEPGNTDPLYAELSGIVNRNGGLWCADCGGTGR